MLFDTQRDAYVGAVQHRSTVGCVAAGPPRGACDDVTRVCDFQVLVWPAGVGLCRRVTREGGRAENEAGARQGTRSAEKGSQKEAINKRGGGNHENAHREEYTHLWENRNRRWRHSLTSSSHTGRQLSLPSRRPECMERRFDEEARLGSARLASCESRETFALPCHSHSPCGPYSIG